MNNKKKKPEKRVSKENGEHVRKSNTDILNKMMTIMMSTLGRCNREKQAKIQENSILTWVMRGIVRVSVLRILSVGVFRYRL